MSTPTPTLEAERVPQWPPIQQRRRAEGSFTLIETMIALAILAFIIVEVAAVQGNAIVFSDYGRDVTRAAFLARRVMSEVEYYWRTKPFPDLATNIVEQKFEDVDDYTYSLEIKEWKFPFVKLLASVMGEKDEEGNREGDGGMSGLLDTVIKQIFGDEPIFMTARVEVAWAEGAQKNSTALTYLLTNQAKLDQAIVQLKPVYDRLTKPKEPPKSGSPTTPAGGTGQPGQPGRPGPGQPGQPGGAGRPLPPPGNPTEGGDGGG